MDYRIGSTIEYSTFSGSMRRVLVTEKEADIKNGRPGFGGDLVNDPANGVGDGVWGYDAQITRVVNY